MYSSCSINISHLNCVVCKIQGLYCMCIIMFGLSLMLSISGQGKVEVE